MQEPYKRILEKRRTQIVEQIKWSRELAAGLEKHGLLSKEDLRYVETEQSSQSRVYAALTRIIASDDPRAFGRFRHLLDELGNKSMAESLDFDRQRIRWDFDKEIHATCLPNYIDLVNAQLLDSAQTEQDDYTRQCLIGVVKRRLEDLRNCIRQQQRDRDNFRAELWQTISGKKLTLSSLSSYRAKDTASLSEIEDAETRRDEVLKEKTKGLVELLRLRVVEQKRDNEGLLETLNNNNISPDKKLLPPVSTDQLENDVDLFANVGAEDVTQSLRDDWTIDEQRGFDGNTDDEKFVRINRSVFDQILQTLKPFENQRSLNARQKEDVVPQIRDNADDPSVGKLIDLLQSMQSELELWRNRSHKLSSELKSFEHEQQLISTALGLQSTYTAADRGVCLQNILNKISALTGGVTPAETTGDIQTQGVDDQTVENGLDGGKSRRSSADEDLGSSRTKSETIVDIGPARNRRMSAPFMRPRPSLALPVLQEHHRNKNPFTYRNSSRDYGGTAAPIRSEQKTATGKFARRSYDFSQFKQRSLDGRSLVAITAEPLATLNSPNNRRRKASVIGQRTSIVSLNEVL